MESHFKGHFEKVRRPPDHLEILRFHMVLKVFPGIPFLKKQEVIFILQILAKVAASASLFRPYGTGQASHGLRQFLALLRKDLHSNDEQDHGNGSCKGPANQRDRRLN